MAQKTEVEIGVRDNATAALKGISGAFEKVKISVENNKAGFNKLDNALKDSAANMAGLQGTAGRLADALLEFTPGGIIGAGVIAGIGLLAANFISNKKAQEENEVATNKFIDALQKLESARNKLNLSATEAAFKDLETESENVTKKFDEVTKKLNDFNIKAQQTEDLYKRQAGQGGFFARFFTNVDAVEAKITQEDLQKIDTDRKAILQEQAVIMSEQVSLMARLKQLGMDAFNNEITRLNTLHELSKIGRVTNAERMEEASLIRKLTNMSRDLNVTAEVRLAALRGISFLEEERRKRQEKAAKQAEMDRKRVDEEQAALLKRLEEEGEAEIRQREESLRIQIENIQRAAEEENRVREAAAKYNDYLANQILSTNKKLTNEQIDFVKKRIEEEQAKLAFFAMRGNMEAATAAQQKITETQEKFIEQIQSTAKFDAIEIGVNVLADAFSAMGAAIASGQNALNAFGKAAKQAIGQSLQILGREQLVKGLSNLASGFAAAALGPIGGKSAKDFFKAAGFNFSAAALAGAGGAALGGTAAGGGGGAGVGGGGFSNSQLGRNNFSTQQPLTIVVQGGLLDMSNPDTQRSFIGALETVSNRRIKLSTVGT